MTAAAWILLALWIALLIAVLIWLRKDGWI